MTSLTRPNDDCLTEKERLACEEYLKCFEYTKAWRIANPEKADNPYAFQYASKFFNRPIIKQYLTAAAQHTLEKATIETDDLIQHLNDIVNFDPMDIMTIDDEGEPVLDLTKVRDKPNVLKNMKIRFGVGVTKEGDRIRTYQAEAYDKMDAIDKLAKLQMIAKGLNGGAPQIGLMQVNVSFPIAGQYRDAGQLEPIDQSDSDEDV